MIYNIRKWRHNSKRTGYVVEASAYDEATKTWHNVRLHVPRADEYAGKNADEQPNTLAMEKDGCLWIKCKVFDNYTPKVEKPKEDKPQF